MFQIIDSLWSLVGAIIAVIIFGLIAGFSPTLYAAQVGVAAAKRAQSLMIALMIGVVLGIIGLTIFFQFFQVDTLKLIINSTLKAIYVSAVFNILIGTAFVIAGFWYIHKKPNRMNKKTNLNPKSGYWALISLGFFRTFLSISGATATFLASTFISAGNVDIITRIILSAIFLAAAIAPFVLILTVLLRQPEKIQLVLDWFKNVLHTFDYRLVIGVTAILVGSAIILFNVLRVLF